MPVCHTWEPGSALLNSVNVQLSLTLIKVKPMSNTIYKVVHASVNGSLTIEYLACLKSVIFR